jgi:hypothetical protein
MKTIRSITLADFWPAAPKAAAPIPAPRSAPIPAPKPQPTGLAPLAHFWPKPALSR